jgi:hydroxyethylthiazole kinase
MPARPLTASTLVGRIAAALGRVRARRPLVHCLTNHVTMGDVANALSAVGARPAMAHAIEEVAEVAARAGALVLNLGTPSRERIEAMLAAALAAHAHGRPVVLDPVRVEASAFRSAAAARLLAEARPHIVRGSAGEIAALARPGRGLGRHAGRTAAGDDAAHLARRLGIVVATSGPRDIVTDGQGTAIIVGHGHPRLGTITGAGDMVTAVIAAFAAVEPDRRVATAGALAVFGLAAEDAARRARGPGSFRSSLLDALEGLTPDRVRRRARRVRVARPGPLGS